MKEVLINHFLNYEFIYIFSFCSLFFLLLSIFIKQDIFKKTSILLFSIFFILFLFEFILSFKMNIFEETNYFLNFDTTIDSEDSDELSFIYEKGYLDDGNIEKKIRSSSNNSTDVDKIIFNAKYSIFKNGFRFVECNKKSKEAYVFLGCSFTFGDGIDDNETLPYYFSKLLDFKNYIINCGVSGRSTNTALNILCNNIIDNKKQIKHFFYLIINDHIYRNFRISDPGDIKIYRNGKCINQVQPYGKIKHIFARSYIFRKIFLPVVDEYNRQYYENYMIASLNKMNKIVEDKYNSKLTIIVWPGLDNDILKRLKETNLDLIFLPEKLDSQENGYKIKYDGHPTAKANKEVAEILYNHINNKDNKNQKELF